MGVWESGVVPHRPGAGSVPQFPSPCLSLSDSLLMSFSHLPYRWCSEERPSRPED